jgi:hypothetical protein
VNVKRLSEETELPVIIVIRKKPDIQAMKKALINHFDDAEERIKLLNEAGEIRELIPGKLYYQTVNLENEEAEEIIKITQRNSLIPEPLRLAHIIASAVMTGESKRE